MDHKNDDVRASIVRFLPRAMEIALSSYREFSVKKALDAKDFKAHQEACKAAAAHVELLLKLAKQTEGSYCAKQSEKEKEELAALVEAARGELDGYEG